MRGEDRDRKRYPFTDNNIASECARERRRDRAKERKIESWSECVCVRERERDPFTDTNISDNSLITASLRSSIKLSGAIRSLPSKCTRDSRAESSGSEVFCLPYTFHPTSLTLHLTPYTVHFTLHAIRPIP